MSETREKLKDIRSAIRNASRETMDLDRLKIELLHWLDQFKFPAYPDASKWEDILTLYTDNDTQVISPVTGSKLRMNLLLYTSSHQYLLSVIECFGLDSEIGGIVALHVNKDKKEINIRHSIESHYKQTKAIAQDPILTLWTQSFVVEEFQEALNSCAIAIFGNELVGVRPKQTREIVTHTHSHQAIFPVSDNTNKDIIE